MVKGDEVRKNSQERADEAFNQIAGELSDGVVEGVKGDHDRALEAFDAFAHRVKSQVFVNMKEFRGRFARGYSVLLVELSKVKGPSKGGKK